MDDKRPRHNGGRARPDEDREIYVNKPLRESDPWITEREWWTDFPRKAFDRLLWFVLWYMAVTAFRHFVPWFDLHVFVHGFQIL